MRVVPRSRLQGYGEDATAAPADDDTNYDVKLKPSTAAAGLGLWVLAGVLTHVLVRVVDRWIFDDR